MSTAVRRLILLALGALAGMAAWPIAELVVTSQARLGSYLVLQAALGVAVGVFLGAAFGSAEGLFARDRRRMISGALLGAAIGAAGGVVGSLAGQGFLLQVGERLMQSLRSQRAFARVVLPVSRAVAWAVLGLFVGACEGARARSPRKIGVGVLGGALGGLVGGALLEESRLLLPVPAVSRLIGLLILGAAIAFFYGLIERGLAAGVLRVLNGRLKGKEFLLNQRRTRIGSSPRAEIALAGYEDLAERHAEVRLRKGEAVLAALERGRPVLVNDRPVEAEHVLKYEDVVKIGSAKLFFRYQ
jgi:hypothetical protein